MTSVAITALRSSAREHGVGTLILCAHALLALGLLRSNGQYEFGSLMLLLASFGALSLAGIAAATGKMHLTAPPAGLLAFVLLVLLIAGTSHTPGIYVQRATYDGFFLRTEWLLIFLVFGAFLAKQARAEKWREGVFLFGVILAFMLRASMLSASPAPVIDTFTAQQEGAQHILEGKNPYGIPVSDVYNGGASFGYQLGGYVYPPADLYIRTAVYALTGDVRWTSILAEAVMALALWAVGTRFLPRDKVRLLILLFLFHPRGLFVLEQSWTDTLILLFFSLFLLCETRKRTSAAAAVYGYMLGLKQYLVFFAFHWFLLRKPFRHAEIALWVLLLSVLPFVLWQAGDFVKNGLLFNVSIPFRGDSLTFANYLHQKNGFTPTGSLSLLSGGIAAIATYLGFRRLPRLTAFAFAVTITTFALFLFGHQAFCNYYYFVGGLMIWLLTMLEHSDTDPRPSMLPPLH
jgi:hypothetical protein